jgi:hypothetical protein
LHRLDDPDHVAREYARLDRFRMRRLDRTGWLRFDDDPEITVLLRAVDEIHPDRVLDELHRHFARVECRPTSGSVVWLARDDLQAYLDAFREMLGPPDAPDGRYPFAARRWNCVLVAETS